MWQVENSSRGAGDQVAADSDWSRTSADRLAVDYYQIACGSGLTLLSVQAAVAHCYTVADDRWSRGEVIEKLHCGRV